MPGPRWPHVADCPSSENEPIVSGGSRMSDVCALRYPRTRSLVPPSARASSPALGGALDLTGGIVTFEQPPQHVPPSLVPAAKVGWFFEQRNARSPTQKKRQAGLRPRGRLSVMTALALWHLFLVATAHAFTPTKTFATFGACERARVASPPRGVRPARLCDPRYGKRRAHQGSARPPVAVQQRAQQGRICARPHVAHLPRLRLRQETTRPRR